MNCPLPTWNFRPKVVGCEICMNLIQFAQGEPIARRLVANFQVSALKGRKILTVARCNQLWADATYCGPARPFSAFSCKLTLSGSLRLALALLYLSFASCRASWGILNAWRPSERLKKVYTEIINYGYTTWGGFGGDHSGHLKAAEPDVRDLRGSLEAI